MDHSTSTAAQVMDEINRRAWRDPASLRELGHLEGFTDEGERVAVARLADEMRGRPILDLGVGAGRTTPILRAISEDYTAIDYTPEMVALCRAKHPEARVVTGDARDLSPFADGTFALVVFSFNGIDAVNHEDRQQILREVRRVLTPGGAFLFSTHNQHGPGHGEPLRLNLSWTRNPVRLAARLARAVGELPRSLGNYLRHARWNDAHGDYSIMTASAHRYGILVHYTTLPEAQRELAAAGFDPAIEVYDCRDGRRVSVDDDAPTTWWFQIIARAARGEA